MDLLLKGGIIMWVLFAISLISTALIIERIFCYYLVIKQNNHFFYSLHKVFAATKEASERILFLKNYPFPSKHPCSAITHLIVQNSHKSTKELKAILAPKMKAFVHSLQRGLTPLNTIASVAPLLGLLGTVLGMIEAFTFTSTTNLIGEEIVGGLSKALITTASGLGVAIPCIVFYNYFSKKIDLILDEMEINTMEMIHQTREQQ